MATVAEIAESDIRAALQTYAVTSVTCFRYFDLSRSAPAGTNASLEAAFEKKRCVQEGIESMFVVANHHRNISQHDLTPLRRVLLDYWNAVGTLMRIEREPPTPGAAVAAKAVHDDTTRMETFIVRMILDAQEKTHNMTDAPGAETDKKMFLALMHGIRDATRLFHDAQIPFERATLETVRPLAAAEVEVGNATRFVKDIFACKKPHAPSSSINNALDNYRNACMQYHAACDDEAKAGVPVEHPDPALAAWMQKMRMAGAADKKRDAIQQMERLEKEAYDLVFGVAQYS